MGYSKSAAQKYPIFGSTAQPNLILILFGFVIWIFGSKSRPDHLMQYWESASRTLTAILFKILKLVIRSSSSYGGKNFVTRKETKFSHFDCVKIWQKKRGRPICEIPSTFILCFAPTTCHLFQFFSSFFRLCSHIWDLRSLCSLSFRIRIQVSFVLAFLMFTGLPLERRHKKIL